MPTSSVNASEVLARGIRDNFVSTYKRKITEVNKRLGMVMEVGIPSDKLTELYGYYLSAPHPKRWPRGEDIPRKGFDSVQFSVTNYDWARAIDWHENDEQDDQLHDLVRQARELATGFAQLDERVFFQLLQASTDVNLLPAVPNAPDGAAFFATTAGGAARFGATSGNLLTGTGATAAAFRTDFYTALEQFRLFQDTEGQPLWPEETLDAGFLIIHGAANMDLFDEAFAQRYVQGTAAAPTNVIIDGGHKVTRWPTQRITDNDWYVFLMGAEMKATFSQERQGLRDNVEDFANSDKTRRTKIKSLQFDGRRGYGIALPYQAIKVNN